MQSCTRVYFLRAQCPNIIFSYLLASRLCNHAVTRVQGYACSNNSYNMCCTSTASHIVYTSLTSGNSLWADVQIGITKRACKTTREHNPTESSMYALYSVFHMCMHEACGHKVERYRRPNRSCVGTATEPKKHKVLCNGKSLHAFRTRSITSLITRIWVL